MVRTRPLRRRLDDAAQRARVAQGEHRLATAATQRRGEGRDVQVGLTGETPGEAQDLRVTVRLAANRDEVLADLRHAVDGD